MTFIRQELENCFDRGGGDFSFERCTADTQRESPEWTTLFCVEEIFRISRGIKC